MQRYPEDFRQAEAQRLRDTRVLQRLLETETEAVERRANAAQRARKYRKAKRERKTNEAAFFGLSDNDACRFCDSFHLAQRKEPEIPNDLGQETEGHSSEICNFPGCNKAVNCREDLESHRVTHRTMSARNKRFQCSICRRKFSIGSLFEEHLASHTGEVSSEMTKTDDVTWKELDESYILSDKLQTDQRRLVVPKTEPLDDPEEPPDVELSILQPKVELEEEPEEELIVDVTSNGSESEGPTPSKRKNYDLKFKLEVVAYAEKHSKSKAAKDKEVNRKQVQEWTKQKTQLEDQLKATASSSNAPCKRIQGAGRPLKDKRFDGRLIDWVRRQRREKLRVSRTIIQKQALTLSTDEDFKASNGWLEKFLYRHNLISRRTTNTCRKEREKYAGDDSDSDVSVDFPVV